MTRAILETSPYDQEANLIVAQPHPHAVPSTDATEGLPASVTATNPQVGEPHAPGPYTPEPPSRSRRGLILAGCAVLGIVIGAGGQRLTAGGGDAAAAPTPSPSASATTVTAQITPVSASGTNFRSKGGVWESQRYANENFGGLKKGIGLLIDLGDARPLTAVTFTAQEGPLTVELRAGDEKSNNGADYQLVGSAVQADGATSLPASAGGSHRYWMIWVTKLSPSFSAKIAEPTAKG